jgi:hypothetical protein
MSITVRLWTDADLLSLASDDNLLTVFFNVKTYLQKEIKRLYQLTEKRKTYFIFFTPLNETDRQQELSEKQINLDLFVQHEESDDYEDCIKVYAVSDESLRWFLKQEYHYSMIDSIIEVVSTTREVSL